VDTISSWLVRVGAPTVADRPRGGHHGGVRIATLLVLAALAGAPGAERPMPGVLVTFDQSGGFAGVERGLVVHRNGKVVSDGFAVGTAKLTPTRLRVLRDALLRARFATLKRRYVSEQPLSDGYEWGITYAGRTVRIEETAKLPPRLERVFNLLNALVHN
jgi:hypothetical protein